METSANCPNPHGHRLGHAHVQIWSTAKIFQKFKYRTDFIFKPKWALLNSKQLYVMP